MQRIDRARSLHDGKARVKRRYQTGAVEVAQFVDWLEAFAGQLRVSILGVATPSSAPEQVKGYKPRRASVAIASLGHKPPHAWAAGGNRCPI